MVSVMMGRRVFLGLSFTLQLCSTCLCHLLSQYLVEKELGGEENWSCPGEMFSISTVSKLNHQKAFLVLQATSFAERKGLVWLCCNHRVVAEERNYRT